MKLPSFQFYPGDWMKDPNLRRCSRAARGMWVDMLCLMFECEDRGVLSTGGEPWSDEDIAAAAGGDISEGLSCIAELLRKGVAHRNQSGAIFSKRMVRDEQIRTERAKAGQKGGSKTKAKAKQTHKQNLPPSSSSSISDSVSNETGASAPVSASETIWTLGKGMLVDGGMSKSSAGGLLSKLINDYGETKVAVAVASTSLKKPANPKDYLVACLSRNGRAHSQAEMNRAGGGVVI